MRKSTIASLASIAMVPALFWSQDSSAIPAFARKYNTSCYTCHSGFPTRNSFGEAFRNNGYRWPGGEDNDHAKREQIKMGADGWKKTFPASPWPVDIPGYAPLSVWVRGQVVNYSERVTRNTGAVRTAETLNYGTGALNTTSIFFGGTMGDNFSAFGQYSPTAGATTGHIVWSFQPGLNLSLGNGFTDFNFGNAIQVHSSVFPSFTTSNSTELSYIKGDTGGIKLTAGFMHGGTAAANRIDDLGYVRAKLKIGGAGLLSGAGGTFGNEYVGLDNHVAVGATLMNAKAGIFTGATTYAGETMVYGGDLTGNYGNFTGGMAVSKDSDLGFTNFMVNGGYFLYPWAKAAITYTSIRDGIDPTVAVSLTTHLRTNAYLTATYSRRTNSKETAATAPLNIGDTTPNTFNVTAGFAF
jgi:hypothetical protein